MPGMGNGLPSLADTDGPEPGTSLALKKTPVEIIEKGSLEPEEFVLSQAVTAKLHPLVRSFFQLSNESIAKRFANLHPQVQPETVLEALNYPARYYQWSGSDFFHAVSEEGRSQMLLIETNSAPTGQDSVPFASEELKNGGYGAYKLVLEKVFMPVVNAGHYNGHELPHGGLAVLYDEEKTENYGFSAALADITGETVYLVPCFPDDPEQKIRFTADGVLEVRTTRTVLKRPGVDPCTQDHGVDTRPANGGSVEGLANGAQPPAKLGDWQPIRAAVRYVTNRPWTRIPPLTKTFLLNPVVSCLAGGRNKTVGAKAYESLNKELASTGLQIQLIETIWDVTIAEVPQWVKKLGGYAVVKGPYSNGGQAVWTITNEHELKDFMSIKHTSASFIVQPLIGGKEWSSKGIHGDSLHQVGTVPDSDGNVYVADLRVIVGCSPDEGWFPVVFCGRRARVPLSQNLEAGKSSWSMLGTNVTSDVKDEDGLVSYELDRLLLMDTEDFDQLGLGIDNLIEGFVQTVLAATAIDKLACKLVSDKGQFDTEFFKQLNNDGELWKELYFSESMPPKSQES